MPDVIPINKNNGMKTFVSISIIVAMVGITAAIVRPIQQQIEAVSDRLHDHTSQNNHPWGAIAEIAEIKQKFVEIETQFDGMREVIDTESVRNTARIEKLERLGILYTEETLKAIAVLEEKMRRLEIDHNDKAVSSKAFQ